MPTTEAPSRSMTPQEIKRVVTKLAVFGDDIMTLLGIAQRITLMAVYQQQYAAGAENFDFVCHLKRLDGSEDGTMTIVDIQVPIADVVDNPDDLYVLRTVVDLAQGYAPLSLVKVERVYVDWAEHISDVDKGFGMPTPEDVDWEFTPDESNETEELLDDEEFEDVDDLEEEEEFDDDDELDDYERVDSGEFVVDEDEDEDYQRCGIHRSSGMYMLIL